METSVMVDALTTTRAEQAAQLLLAARKTGVTLPHFPEELRPTSQADAHLIQEAMLKNMGTIGGWKVFAGDDPAPFLSPIPANLIWDQGAQTPRGPLPIVLAELEIAVVLSRDLPGIGNAYSPETVRAAIGSLHPLIELITFSWTDRDHIDRLTQLADLQNSAGFVVGEAKLDWQALDTSNIECTLLVDGVEQATTSNGANLQTIVATIAMLANHAVTRGMPLRKGQVITTGARAIASTRSGSTVLGKVEKLGSVYAATK
jgi:2-keto-4-pentenoate hydratase